MKISSNVQIVEISRPKLEDPILIQGLPGLGFVGKIVVDFLIDQLKPVKFAELYSPNIALPDGDVGVTVELDSTFTLPKYEFYAYTGRKPHVIFLTGDTQPSPWGQYNVARSVLDFIEGFECKTVVALGGYALQRRDMDIVYAVGSDPSIIGDLKEKFNVQPAQSGMIKGAFGVTLGLGKGKNLKCIGLLGATAGTYPDLRASRNVIRIVAGMFDMPVVLSDMDKKIEEMDSRMKRFRDISRNMPTRESQEGGEPPRGYIS